MNQVKDTIEILPQNECCGCEACANGCPVNAIEMKVNQDGFRFPQVKEEICIHCGKCVRICPALEPKYTNRKKPDCYAAYGPDEIRMESSSGGIFTLVAQEVIKEGGVVCGAVLTEDFEVKHVLVEKIEDLAKLRGSKYVQSQIGNIYQEVGKLLKAGKKVFFTGVPCQIAGLKGCLGKEYEHLLTADVLCHGTPAPGIFQKYLQETYGKKELADFKFRTKEFGHSCTNCIATLKNGRRIVGNPANDPYEKAFHSSLMLREACGNCKFAPTPRQGDLTMGDFWHIEKYHAGYSDPKGVSLLLINSEKGEQMFSKIKERLCFCEPVPAGFTLKHNRFRSKIRISEGRERFFTANQQYSFRKAVEIGSGEKFSKKQALKQWLKRKLPPRIWKIIKK